MVMRPIFLLLAVPYFALLLVPLYNMSEPSLFGFPFFYWYQMLWIPGTSFLLYLVYRKARDDR
jgi:hypothetical protein